jgi:hypothetical protein
MGEMLFERIAEGCFPKGLIWLQVQDFTDVFTLSAVPDYSSPNELSCLGCGIYVGKLN